MKKIIIIILALFTTIPVLLAQTQKEITKERKEIAKRAKEEARKRIKEGWTISAGALPLEKQLEKSYLMQRERNDNGDPKYIMGEGMATSRVYEMAKVQTLMSAQQELTLKVQTKAITTTDSGVVSTTVTSQAIMQRVISVVEMHRVKNDKRIDVWIQVACEAEIKN